MSYPCEVCGRPFSTPGNSSRHKKLMHSTSTDERRLSVIGTRSSVMQHPFTCIVAVCTQSGKTVWVKLNLSWRMLRRPPPQRTIWCYGQWQPSYFDMLRTIIFLKSSSIKAFPKISTKGITWTYLNGI